MVIKNYDSNYFWSIIVDSIYVFDCAYKVWFYCMPHDVTVDIFFAAASPTLYHHFEPKFYVNFRQSEVFLNCYIHHTS